MTTGRINQVSSVSTAHVNLQLRAWLSDATVTKLLHCILNFIVLLTKSFHEFTRKAGNQFTNSPWPRCWGKFEKISSHWNATSVAKSTLSFRVLPLDNDSNLLNWVQNSMNSPTFSKELQQLLCIFPWENAN